MKIAPSTLPEVLIIEPKVFPDARGFFLETYQSKRYGENGVSLPFVQDNLSSSQKGTLRGLHFQHRHPQGKLIHVVAGEIFDVAVDIRPKSPNFGKWFGCHLNEANQKQIYVPPGFAHGFVVLSERAFVWYKCTDYYYPEFEAGIRWDDPKIGICWPIAQPLLSDRDSKLPFLESIPSSYFQNFNQ